MHKYMTYIHINMYMYINKCSCVVIHELFCNLNRLKCLVVGCFSCYFKTNDCRGQFSFSMDACVH